MTSYQRKKQEIKYLRQCVKELEEITMTMAAKLGEAGLSVPITQTPLSGDSYRTPYNTGAFAIELMHEAVRHNRALVANSKPLKINLIKGLKKWY